MDIHDAANIFPLDEEHLDELAADIKANGLRVPIERLNGKVIDGRRRLRACEKAGITPQFRDVTATDPVSYVLSLNLHRRHLTPGQLSMVGARARQFYDEQAKQRQKEAGKSHGRGKVVENLPQANAGTARDAVGKAVGVSGKSIDHATRVLAKAEPEVVKAVDEGRMAVSAAAALATESAEVQREEANNPKRKKQKNGPPAVGGDAVRLAHDAINCLRQIPQEDRLRKRGFQIVVDWIRHNE